MNAHAPPKQESRPGGAANLEKLRLRTAYRFSLFPQAPNRSLEQMLREIQGLRAIQAPFGFVFWFLEQKIGRLTDEMERRQS